MAHRDALFFTQSQKVKYTNPARARRKRPIVFRVLEPRAYVRTYVRTGKAYYTRDGRRLRS